MACAEFDRHGDRQFAARRAIFARCAPFGLVQVGDDPTRGLDIVAPGVGELDVAAGPDEEIGAEMPFEFGDLTLQLRKDYLDLVNRRLSNS